MYSYPYDLDLIIAEEKALIPFFDEYIPKKNIPSRILSFGCGIANEFPALENKYASFLEEFIGFDNDKYVVRTAQVLGRKNIFNFDVNSIHHHLNGVYGLVLGRNIPINPSSGSSDSDLDTPWSTFFKELKTYMSSNSDLLLTFPRDDEYFLALDLLNKQDYSIHRSEPNKVIVPSDRIGIVGADTKDNYVILAKS
jgi:hypothetical protein